MPALAFVTTGVHDVYMSNVCVLCVRAYACVCVCACVQLVVMRLYL